MFPSRNIKIKRTYVTTFPSFHSQVRSGQGRRQLRVPGKKEHVVSHERKIIDIFNPFLNFRSPPSPRRCTFSTWPSSVSHTHGFFSFFARSNISLIRRERFFFSNRKNGDGFPTVRIGTASQIKFGFGGGKTHIPVDVFQSLPPPSLPDSDPFNLNPGNKTRNISPKNFLFEYFVLSNAPFFFVVPKVRIFGNHEIHVQAGSEVQLKCVVSQAVEHPSFVVWWGEISVIFLASLFVTTSFLSGRYHNGDMVVTSTRRAPRYETISRDTSMAILTIK